MFFTEPVFRLLILVKYRVQEVAQCNFSVCMDELYVGASYRQFCASVCGPARSTKVLNVSISRNISISTSKILILFPVSKEYNT